MSRGDTWKYTKLKTLRHSMLKLLIMVLFTTHMNSTEQQLRLCTGSQRAAMPSSLKTFSKHRPANDDRFTVEFSPSPCYPNTIIFACSPATVRWMMMIKESEVERGKKGFGSPLRTFNNLLNWVFISAQQWENKPLKQAPDFCAEFPLTTL